MVRPLLLSTEEVCLLSGHRRHSTEAPSGPLTDIRGKEELLDRIYGDASFSAAKKEVFSKIVMMNPQRMDLLQFAEITDYRPKTVENICNEAVVGVDSTHLSILLQKEEQTLEDKFQIGTDYKYSGVLEWRGKRVDDESQEGGLGSDTRHCSQTWREISESTRRHAKGTLRNARQRFPPRGFRDREGGIHSNSDWKNTHRETDRSQPCVPT